MADQVATPAIGAWRAILDGSTGAGTVGVAILKTAQADGTLRTYKFLSDLLAAGGGTANVEANWSGGVAYARKTGVTPTVTEGTALVDGDIPDQTWATAGDPGTPQQLAKIIVYWRYTANTADSASRVLCHLDYPEYANGASITATINATGILRGTA